MNSKGLTLTIIFKAQSLNYGEGIGNISELKKLARGNGNVYTFASRQALRYDIARIGNKLYNWNLEVVDKEKGTIQFKDELNIKDSQEMDLFGYMKTSKKSAENEDGGSETRSAAVRLSHALSLEEYKSDMDFLTNKGLADRIDEFPNLANVEQHLSYYTYTVTVDLPRVGKDGNIELSQEEKTNRVLQLLEIIKILNRDIRGREENLSPLFIVGGIYNINTPFFLGRIKLEAKGEDFKIDTKILESAMELKIGENSVKENTFAGIVPNEFKNEEELKKLFGDKMLGIQEFFDEIENEVKEYYAE
mgnify:FL=1